MTHQPGSKGPRSQSATRNGSAKEPMKDLRRKSVAVVGEKGLSRSPNSKTLQVYDRSPNLANRRCSSIKLQSSPRLGSSVSCRSRSLKSPSQRRKQDIPHSSSGSNLNQNQDSRSLTFSLSVPDDNEFDRLRNFSITSKGIINRGDSFRCKSAPVSPSSAKTLPNQNVRQVPDIAIISEEQTATTSSSVSQGAQGDSSSIPCTGQKTTSVYNVWIMGLAGVGKTSLKLQFMTSEYICEQDMSRDENKNVTIVLDGDEVELEITDWPGFDEKALAGHPLPDAFIVLYSATNRRSYVEAKHILSYLEPMCRSKAVILVGNKTDLARLRAVSTVEGRSLAKEWGCKFIETSVAINHQVDELLVGIISQIRIKEKLNEKHKRKQGSTGFSQVPSQSPKNKATGIIIRFWRKTCMPNKSCDNLHSV